MVRSYLAYLEKSVFLDKPSIFVNLLLTIFQSQELMLRFNLSIFLKFLFDLLNFLWEFTCLAHFGVQEYVLLS